MEYKFCKDTAIVCRYKEKGSMCKECVDTTEATNFLLREIKPKSGNLNGVIANMDYMAYLMELYANFKAASIINSIENNEILSLNKTPVIGSSLSDERSNGYKEGWSACLDAHGLDE